MILFSFELRFETGWTRRKKKKKGRGKVDDGHAKNLGLLGSRLEYTDGWGWCNFMIFPRRSFNSRFQPARDSCAGKWPVRTFVTLLNRAVLQLINVHLTSVLFFPWKFGGVFLFLSRCVRTCIFDIYGRILKRSKFSFNQPDFNRFHLYKRLCWLPQLKNRLWK